MSVLTLFRVFIAVGVVGAYLEYQVTQEAREIFDAMDAHGQYLFGHWILGSGSMINVIDDNVWAPYMKKNAILKGATIVALREQAAQKCLQLAQGVTMSVEFDIDAELENGYSTGYNLLHQAHRYSFKGNATKVTGQIGTMDCCKICFDGIFTWKDMIDPNGTYILDTLSSGFISMTSGYTPQDYATILRWSAKPCVTFPGGLVGSGWPGQ